jgi:hypothetical protein
MRIGICEWEYGEYREYGDRFKKISLKIFNKQCNIFKEVRLYEDNH